MQVDQTSTVFLEDSGKTITVVIEDTKAQGLVSAGGLNRLLSVSSCIKAKEK